MKLLAIETALEACSVALWLDGECRERYGIEPRSHAGNLLPWVDELLSESELSLGGLDVIAFSRGPGSFTSLRIGISTVQGLAFGAGLGVAPVSSLHAAAQVAAGQGVARALVAMDARMGEVYWGAYTLQDGLMRPVLDDRLSGPEAVAPPDAEKWAAVGSGFERFEHLRALANSATKILPGCWPRASAVAEIALDWLKGNEALPPEAAQPVYLRDKVAEKPTA